MALDPEFVAIRRMSKILDGFDKVGKARVLTYLIDKLNVNRPDSGPVPPVPVTSPAPPSQ